MKLSLAHFQQEVQSAGLTIVKVMAITQKTNMKAALMIQMIRV